MEVSLVIQIVAWGIFGGMISGAISGWLLIGVNLAQWLGQERGFRVGGRPTPTVYQRQPASSVAQREQAG